MEDDDALFDLVGLIVKHGVARVTDTPEEALTRLARRMGYLHDTNYGLVLDVKSEFKPWFRALSGDAIPPHTDNAYRYTPTGISLFHCVRQLDGRGGESFYVDGLRLAERLRDFDADAHAFLCGEPLTFLRQCHVDREELHSRWRLLGARLGRPVREKWITPGVSV